MSTPCKKARAKPDMKDEVKKVAARMRRPKPTNLELTNGPDVELDNAFLDCLAEGGTLSEAQWRALVGLLITKQIPTFNPIFNSNESGLFKLAPGQKQFVLAQARNNVLRSTSSRYIQVFEGASSEVKAYAAREVWCAMNGAVQDLGWLVETDSWKLKFTVHQETPLKGDNHAPFQDAILFDMLLDLAVGNFKPHTRTMSDGPAIQREILEALEKVQSEVEGAARTTSKKRRMTIQERLEAKRMKME